VSLANAIQNKKHTVSQLAHTNETCHIFIENLESATVFLRLAGLTETTGAVEDFQEGVEVDCERLANCALDATHPDPDLDLDPGSKTKSHTVTSDRLLQVTNLSKCRVLTAGAQQITEEITGDTTGAATVEERKCFFVVGGGLVVFVIISHGGINDGQVEVV
jgi:hypothetical protein